MDRIHRRSPAFSALHQINPGKNGRRGEPDSGGRKGGQRGILRPKAGIGFPNARYSTGFIFANSASISGLCV